MSAKRRPVPNPDPSAPMFESLEDFAEWAGWSHEQTEKVRADMIATEPQDGSMGLPMKRNGETAH